MIHKTALSAMVAALYAGLSLALAPLSFGVVQFRAAEALTLLPFFLPEAVPGLFVGCLLANLIGGLGIIDIVLGSAATLAAAWLSSKSPNIWAAAAAPVAVNAVVVGGYLSVITNTPLAVSVSYLALSEAGVCFLLGVPLCRLLMNSGVVEKFRKIRG